MNRKDVQDIVKNQESNTQREFERRSKDIIVQFAEQGLNAAVYYENPDPREYLSLVPTSAITGKTINKYIFGDKVYIASENSFYTSLYHIQAKVWVIYWR